MQAIASILLWLLVQLRLIQAPDFVALTIPDHPELSDMRPGKIYIVGGKGYQKWGYFRCPADLSEIVQLSLMENRRPRWKINTDLLGRPTVHPSVRQLDGSFAHFWIKKGKINWCADSGRRPASKI